MDTLHLQKRLVEFIRAEARPLIVILGPTASGKTSFSIELALWLHEQKMERWLDGEMVNADSRQLYKYLDIGTAKIAREEMRGIPHHLLDVLDPKEEATAAWYKKEAERVIGEIHARGHVPMLVGGSMLYISAVIDGLEFVTASDPTLRKKLEQEYDADDGAKLYQRLMEIDPNTATAFSVKNKPYVIRAMEIYENTGKRPSDARTQSAAPYDLFIIGIKRPREELTRRINQRTEELFKKGWVKEVQGLLEKGYTENDPAMKSHGYREIIEKLKVESGKWKISDQKIVEELIASKTRQYAKRQMTWWIHDKRIFWLPR